MFSIVKYHSISISIVHYRSVSFRIVQYRAVSCSIVQYRSVSLSIVQFRSVRLVSFSIVQHRSVSFSIVQYRSVLFSIIHRDNIINNEIKWIFYIDHTMLNYVKLLTLLRSLWNAKPWMLWKNKYRFPPLEEILTFFSKCQTYRRHP